jgi:hypothetical protein
LDEETALREVTARKKALSGRAQIDIGEHFAPMTGFPSRLEIRMNQHLGILRSWS